MITFAQQKFHIMAEKELYDSESMIMRAQYAMSLIEDSWREGNLSDMEREDFKRQISELLQGMTALLDSNTKLGQELSEAREDLTKARNDLSSAQDDLLKANKKIDILQSEIKYLKGKQNASNRHRFGDKGEKNTNGTSKSKGRTKDEDENDYIENEGRNGNPSDQCGSSSSEATSGGSSPTPAEKAPRDTSNRPDHYNTMHADVYVEHDCDLDALKAMGLTFLHYSRPIDQFDRISVIRQDRYKTAWVRDKDGNEYAIFIPKANDVASRPCVFANEYSYDRPRLVAHTSCTHSLLSDLAVNRFQYAMTSGREMTRMLNEKMHMAPQTIFNWLKWGAEELKGGLKHIKKKLLKHGTVVYCDETWVDVKVVEADGTVHYVKRYMWVIVNLTTKVCYYLYGDRKRETIEKFLGDFKGTLMTDAYAAYAFFNKLKDCTHVCCWAHARRIFVSALRDYKDEMARVFIDLIKLLYKVELENIFFHRTEQEVVKTRKLESIPILSQLLQKANELLKMSDSKKIRISEKLHQALKYMTNNWQELYGYVNIGNVLIDNNCCERAVRPFTNLRKNFGGFSSEAGAIVAAIYLTFVETCKLMKKTALDFFKGFFGMTTSGRTDYELIVQELLC